MHTIQTVQPRPELRQYVRCFAHREMMCADETFDLSFIASLEPILSFNLADREVMECDGGESHRVPPFHVLGPQSHMTRCAHFTGRVVDFGIFLTPLAPLQLFRVPPSVLVDNDLDGEDLCGKGSRELLSRLADARSFAERVIVAEQYLLPFALGHSKRSYVMDSAAYLVRHRGSVPIKELANRSSMSLRQYERRFVEEIGMSPKRFARISRFQMALDAKRMASNPSWLEVAHKLEYYDQMHMVDDFHALGSGAPGQVMQQSGDLQPWSLASATAVNVRPAAKVMTFVPRRSEAS
jgi:AraC-like DNA-binding protein